MASTSDEQGGSDELVGQVEGSDERCGCDEKQQQNAVGQPAERSKSSAKTSPDEQWQGQETNEIPVPRVQECIGKERDVKHQSPHKSL